ncbi:MAG: hypothetical protein KF716_07625 [Anaerolineae bacterium]|nr:hypothetical protein [Anaerolineae bacterium]
MPNPERYPYLQSRNASGESMSRPILPLALTFERRRLVANGLLDTGATVNVLPFEVGIALGISWDEPRRRVILTGNLARYTAQVLPLMVEVGHFDPVALIFAWTEAENVPLILGQVNFFGEFDVCFFAARLLFEIQPKAT